MEIYSVKAAVTQDIFLNLIGNSPFRHLWITSFDWPPESKGIDPGELTPMIGCVGVDSIDIPQLNDGKWFA